MPGGFGRPKIIGETEPLVDVTTTDSETPKIEKKTPWEAFSNIPEDINRDLLKVFEKYNLGENRCFALREKREWLFELCLTRAQSGTRTAD